MAITNHSDKLCEISPKHTDTETKESKNTEENFELQESPIEEITPMSDELQARSAAKFLRQLMKTN